MAVRERTRERLRLFEQGLLFANQHDLPEDDGDFDQRMGIGGALGSLLQELSCLQNRMVTLMDKIGLLPLEIIREMRDEIIEVTDQLRNLNRSNVQ